MIGCIILFIEKNSPDPATKRYRRAHQRLCGLLETAGSKSPNTINTIRLVFAVRSLVASLSAFGATIEDIGMIDEARRNMDDSAVRAREMAERAIEDLAGDDGILNIAAGRCSPLDPSGDDKLDAYMSTKPPSPLTDEELKRSRAETMPGQPILPS
ncbi:MAG: hypothetical protein CSA81_14530 [Acidobacteria bacterium]|nr:MAG: hypothetical protein CSA81_14530 [Acidobacteriota bacterium]